MKPNEFGIVPVRQKMAVIYLRVSSEEQVDNYSLETQEEICTREAAKNNLQVLDIFREKGKSAKNIAGRPTLVEMLEYCRKHKKEIDSVIVYRLDRISRQTSDYLSIRKKLTECEITLISATEPTGNSPTEKFVETMLAGFAQMDNDVKGERTRNGLRKRLMAGLPNGGVAIGYVNQDGYAIKHPKYFDILKEGWLLMATGTKSLREVTELLNEQGMMEQRTGHKEYPIRVQTLGRIFHNKFYMGKITSRKYGLEVQGQHTPMVSEEQFYQVQDVLDGRNTRYAASMGRRVQDNEKFPLRRLVKCGICGQSFTGALSKGKTKSHGYYFCQKRCGVPSSVSLKDMDNARKKFLKKYTPSPETIELLTAKLRTTYYDRIGGLKGIRDQSDVELKKLYSLRQSLIEKNLSGVYSDEIFKEQNAGIEARVKTIQTAKQDADLEKYDLNAITEFIRVQLGDLNSTYELSSLGQKKVLLSSIFPSGLVWGYPGLSNTKKSPFYKAFSAHSEGSITPGAAGGNRTPTSLRKQDFESSASTNSATAAGTNYLC